MPWILVSKWKAIGLQRAVEYIKIKYGNPLVQAENYYLSTKNITFLGQALSELLVTILL